MAWIACENGLRYYSRHVREGRDVRRVSLGRGPLAELAAALDGARRAEREALALATRAEVARHAAATVALAAFVSATRKLMGATLGSVGYSQHDRGEWRRRMGAIEGAQAAGPTADDSGR